MCLRAGSLGHRQSEAVYQGAGVSPSPSTQHPRPRYRVPRVAPPTGGQPVRRGPTWGCFVPRACDNNFKIEHNRRSHGTTAPLRGESWHPATAFASPALAEGGTEGVVIGGEGCPLRLAALGTSPRGRGEGQSLPIAYCLLPIAYCLLPIAYRRSASGGLPTTGPLSEAFITDPAVPLRSGLRQADDSRGPPPRIRTAMPLPSWPRRRRPWRRPSHCSSCGTYPECDRRPG